MKKNELTKSLKQNKMSINLYRLYAVQSFNGEKVAVYINEGNYPEVGIITGATDIAEGTRTRGEVIQDYPWLFEYGWNRDRLTYFTRVLKRSKKVMDENENVDKAIFVNSTNKKEWRGEITLYKNTMFDTIKCDTPQYSFCETIGTIKI